MDINALAGSYPVLDGDRAAGTLEVSPRGGYLRFRAACRMSGQTLARLAVQSGERTADLGTLVPEGGLWVLDRRFSPADLRAMGVEEIAACFLRRPAPEGWTPEPEPGRLLEDRLLRCLCAGLRGALTRQGERGTLLAVPLADPFPLLPVFCLGSLRQLDGRPYLVFEIFAGKPGMIPQRRGMLGTVNHKTDETGVTA